MRNSKFISDPIYVRKQYHEASNLDARIRLHLQCSTNKYGWQRWLFDHIEFPPQGRILELGCGVGNLWRDNSDRIPETMEIILSDLSPGMLDQARKNLGDIPVSFKFKIIDAQSLPFDDQSFDMVIANHMLQHVPDRQKAVAEIRRVLKPGGRFYASTTGDSHLKELADLLGQFDPRLASFGKLPADSFTLENGSNELHGYFEHVSLFRYEDSLVVTDPQPLIDYILSTMTELSTEKHLELAKFVEQELKSKGGNFYISKDSGLFEAWNVR